MKRLILFIFVCFSVQLFAAEAEEPCSHWTSFFKPMCMRLHQIWYEGDTEGILTGYAWHNRYTYSPEKIKKYNEAALGGGLGKGFYDEKGNWHALYAMAFLDSHSNVEPAAGYAYQKVFTIHNHLKAGLGFSILVTSRADINNNIPFPGVLPWASIIYKKVTIAATYIPGTSSNGNVLFLLGKYTF